jgi:hypothetical protein
MEQRSCDAGCPIFQKSRLSVKMAWGLKREGEIEGENSSVESCLVGGGGQHPCGMRDVLRSEASSIPTTSHYRREDPGGTSLLAHVRADP